MDKESIDLLFETSFVNKKIKKFFDKAESLGFKYDKSYLPLFKQGLNNLAQEDRLELCDVFFNAYNHILNTYEHLTKRNTAIMCEDGDIEFELPSGLCLRTDDYDMSGNTLEKVVIDVDGLVYMFTVKFK